MNSLQGVSELLSQGRILAPMFNEDYGPLLNIDSIIALPGHQAIIRQSKVLLREISQESLLPVAAPASQLTPVLGLDNIATEQTGYPDAIVTQPGHAVATLTTAMPLCVQNAHELAKIRRPEGLYCLVTIPLQLGPNSA